MHKISDEAVVEAYRATGSVWKAGKRVGLAGQTVHERLRALGIRLKDAQWDEAEEAELAELLRAGVPLREIAERLNRTYGAVATRSSKLGLGSGPRRGSGRIPRGKGYDKRNVKKHLKALEASDLTVTQYARTQGLHVDPFVKAIERHFPERWKAYVAAHAKLPERTCPYCERVFLPNSGRQIYCSRKCAEDGRRDRQHFGGRRRATIGLSSGVCQLCGEKPKRGLSSHHVWGKENDPNNELLIALCSGCHQIVGRLAGRRFVDDASAWEALISLVWLRKHGGRAAPGHDTIHTTVELETYCDDGREGIPGDVAPASRLSRTTDRLSVWLQQDDP